jgi:Holliday junction resolvasome RuvABC endonuclease subunit
MLRLPADAGSIISVVGIDPGTTTLGTSVLWIDLNTMRIVSSFAKTFRGDRLQDGESWLGFLHGDRFSRIAAIEGALLDLFQRVRPFMIVSEAPFISMRQPQAYGALTEVMCGIMNAMLAYDPWKPLYRVDPPTVKKKVGAPGNADKNAVKQALLRLPDLNYQGETPLAMLDEHSVDALAVAYGKWRAYLEEMNYVVTV